MGRNARYRLPGRVAAGVFSHERVFSVEGADGETIHVIVPAADIDESGEKPTAPVVVRGRSREHSLVTVPGDPLETGQTVWVADRDLIPA